MIPSLLQLLCMAISARHAYDASSHDKVRHGHHVTLGVQLEISIGLSFASVSDGTLHQCPMTQSLLFHPPLPVLQDFCIPSAEDAEGAVGFMLRHLMPCYLELAGFNKLMNK